MDYVYDLVGKIKQITDPTGVYGVCLLFNDTFLVVVFTDTNPVPLILWMHGQ